MTEKPEKIVTDSVISILLAERGMGPKVYGTFIGGRVGEYIEVISFYLLFVIC